MFTQTKKKVQFQELVSLAPTLTPFNYIMNPGILGTQTNNPWHIQNDGIFKFDGI